MKSRHDSTIFKKACGLLIQHIGQETLIYSEALHKAFCLNPMAAQVWRLLDGVRTPEQIAAAVTSTLSLPVAEDLVLFTISELRRDGLLDERDSSASVLAAPSRRDLMRQLGAGAVVMIPLVAAVMTPKAAQAYTGCLDCNVQGAPNSRLRQQAIAQQQAATSKTTQAQQDDGASYGDPTLLK
jgi:hypothetical protein